jgi:clan AA aspartic protease
MLVPADRAKVQRISATDLAASKAGGEMGLVYAEIELISGDDLVLHRRGYIKEEEIKRLKVSALVDSGAEMLAINETVKQQLNLFVLDTQRAELADGSKVELEVVGPVEIRFANRRASVDAIVLPGDVQILLGAIPMEEMDVLVDPKRQQLTVNPEHPDKPEKFLK